MSFRINLLSGFRTAKPTRLLAALAGAAFLGIAGASPANAAAQPVGIHNIVLIHGAWADGASWSKVIPLLQAKGYHVTAVHCPLSSLADDVAATQRAIADQDGPVLLVGHSYGGAIITEAGNDARVAGLVYVAAFGPDTGEAVADQGKGFPPPPGIAEVKPDASGFLYLSEKGIAEDFAQDLPVPERQVMFATQAPPAGAAFGAKISNAAWHSKPSWYAVASHDRMIAPGSEAVMAKRMGADTIELPASHVAMLSHPTEVAELIVKAARGASPK